MRPRVSLPGRWGPALLAIALSVLGTESASAFCRSTTCQDSAEDCPRDADGCRTTGIPLFWRTKCVGFSIQKDGTVNLPFEGVTPVIEKAFLTWTDVDCGGSPASMAFSRLADVSCHANEYNEGLPNANIVLFQDDIWRYKGLGNTLAKTTVTFDHDTGEILDADIELNYAFNHITIGDDAVAFDLQSILTHEIGHFIGFDHSADPDATMNATYDEGDTSLRTLEADDVAAVCAAYDPARAGTCDPVPRGGLADACQATSGCACSTAAFALEIPSSSAVPSGAALVLLAGVLRARRRRLVD